jgi:hypothetical protein
VKDVYRRAGEADAEVRIQFVDQVTWAEYQGSRPVGGWAYSYVAGPLEGSAIFDLPLATAQRLDRLARGRVSPTFLTDLQAVVSGQRQREDLREGDHLRYIAQLMENGIEATWTPVMGMDMHDIHLEADPDHPWRRVAEPADVVAYVQLATSEGDVALRACYPYQTLIPELPTLAEIGRRGHA